MHLNYLILAHGNFNQVNRLINALITEQTFFFVHIDRAIPLNEVQDYDFFTHKQVKVLKKRITVNWGGYNMVAATLSLMKAAIKENRKGYFVLLSGQDYPLVSNDVIINKLSKNYGYEYLSYWKLPYKNWTNGGNYRIDYYWFVDKIGLAESKIMFNLQMDNDFKRNFFKDFIPYGGSQWWCLTYECICYILKFVQYNPLYVEYFEHTLIPDEIFFNTIVLNSPFKGSVINDNLKFLKFEDGASHPKTFRKNDFKAIINSKKMWARKFNMTIDTSILDKIDFNIRSGANS
jgi:hypothetical protein